MTLVAIEASQALLEIDAFDALIDARSPAEFADDHLPEALNWPSLDDDERAAVGTEYKQISAFDARKRGAALVARRIAEHIERHVMDKPSSWRPLVYCWRGGQRSGTLAWFLSQVGFRTTVLKGGYQAFRAQVRSALAELPMRLNFVVVAGRTGSGKTRLLQSLQEAGAQVLDLEALAHHRGSILGGWPGEAQPTQKAFEMQIWDALRRFDPARPVFVESESRKIGMRQVPDVLLERMRHHGRCVVIDMPDAARVALLLEDYAFYTRDPVLFNKHVASLTALRGHDTVARWQAAALEGRWDAVFLDLMHTHYDPLYAKSMARNFAVESARTVRVRDGSKRAMLEAAATLLDS